MNEKEFWSIIEMLDWKEEGDDDAVLAPVVNYLVNKSDDDIFGFEEMLAQKLHALDSRNNAKQMEDYELGDEVYFSVDGFLYARCVVVANGQKFFEEVLEDSSKFPGDLEFESILYVAQEAFEQKNNKEWDYVSPTDYETFSNRNGWS